jgi:tRNA G18 (ribose-2'-O)-methylase SpoU
MGAHFTHPALASTWSDLDTFRSGSGLKVFAADAGGDEISMDWPATERIALVLGNEGAGLSPEARARADRTIALPVSNGVESLNVAVAAGILLYVLTR